MKKTDPEIQKDVLGELEWDPHLRGTEVGVSVDRGVVTLSGKVDSRAKLEAAQAAAHRVPSVRDVANDLELQLSGEGSRSDTDIARAVRDSLEWDVFVPDSRIQSTVCHGEVTLEGDVDSDKQRDDAEKAVHNLLGVTRVINRLKVGSTREVARAATPDTAGPA